MWRNVRLSKNDNNLYNKKLSLDGVFARSCEIGALTKELLSITPSGLAIVAVTHEVEPQRFCYTLKLPIVGLRNVKKKEEKNEWEVSLLSGYMVVVQRRDNGVWKVVRIGEEEDEARLKRRKKKKNKGGCFCWRWREELRGWEEWNHIVG